MARPTPADSDQGVGQPGLGLEVAPPQLPGGVADLEFFPARGAVQGVVGHQFVCLVDEFVAHPVLTGMQQRDRPRAGGRPGSPAPERTADLGSGQFGGQHPGEAALAAEDVGTRAAAARSPAVLVAGRAGAQPQASGQCVLEEPGARSPCRVHLDQTLQSGVVPVQDGAPPADVRDQQIGLRIVSVGVVEPGDRPCSAAQWLCLAMP